MAITFNKNNTCSRDYETPARARASRSVAYFLLHIALVISAGPRASGGSGEGKGKYRNAH